MTYMANAKQVDIFVGGYTGDDGEPLAGGKVTTYEAGTTSNKTTWVDALKAVASANPVILDGNGRATFYADGNYKFKITDSADVLVDTIDNMFFQIPDSSNKAVDTVTATPTTLTTSNDIVLVNAAGGAKTINLPTAAGNSGKEFVIKKTDSSANNVTIDPNGAETIDGLSTRVLSVQNSAITMVSDGSNWFETRIYYPFGIITLTDQATIATDVSLGHEFRVTLGDNRALGVPTNPIDGQKVVWKIKQDNTGSRTLTLNAIFVLSDSIDDTTLSTAGDDTDFLAAIYDATAVEWRVVGFVKGYAA